MQIKKFFFTEKVSLIILGLAVNIGFVGLTNILKIPLYLDSLGTVLVASLCGTLPGIAVGFFSNCINALTSVSPDPMTLYYGFLSVLIAVTASWFSKKGLFNKWYGLILGVIAFSLIGGALGSALTWFLYGFSFGAGISAPYAERLHYVWGFSAFSAQFTADMLIDLIDKAIIVLLLWTTIKIIPYSLLEKLPLGYIYKNKKGFRNYAKRSEPEKEALLVAAEKRKRSINKKITMLILVSTSVLSIIAVTIGIVKYRNDLILQYSKVCEYAVNMMLPKINADKVNKYLRNGEYEPGYRETESDLYDIMNNADDIKYMYVYQIREDGCHVVFDLDTPDLKGEAPGTYLSFDESFPYINELILGEEIPSVITNDTYGWLLTVYKPIKNSFGEVVAYAAADVEMAEIKTNVNLFLISVASLLFGIMIVIALLSIWYCDRKLLEPLKVLEKQALEFDYGGDTDTKRVRDSYSVKTGDELEDIFEAMCNTEDAIAGHIKEINDKNVEISIMQRNIIFTLANMVENRDANTGGHIKRTASYVKLIGEKLKQAGYYKGIIDDEYIKKLYDSAPLHDIGKINVPDAILNKPGKLTDEEFEIIKQHTVTGGKVLKESLTQIEDGSWLSMAIDMAMYHHEKWNGKGYPSGLSKEEIPLCARIMAVSDVFDALVSERSYKKPISLDEALEIIKEDSGIHFDPKVAEVFVASKEEIKIIMNS